MPAFKTEKQIAESLRNLFACLGGEKLRAGGQGAMGNLPRTETAARKMQSQIDFKCAAR